MQNPVVPVHAMAPARTQIESAYLILTRNPFKKCAGFIVQLRPLNEPRVSKWSVCQVPFLGQLPKGQAHTPETGATAAKYWPDAGWPHVETQHWLATSLIHVKMIIDSTAIGNISFNPCLQISANTKLKQIHTKSIELKFLGSKSPYLQAKCHVPLPPKDRPVT